MTIEIAFLHTHVLVLVLFLILFTAKAILLLLSKEKMLRKVKKHTRVLDILFGTLILLTGSYLVFKYNSSLPVWLVTKIVLVLLAIPAGIVGLKRNNRTLTVLSLLLFVYIYGVAETKSLSMAPESTRTRESRSPFETPVTDAVETGDTTLLKEEEVQEEIIAAMRAGSLANAKAIYVQVCANCHGTNGDKGLGGAAKLSTSYLSQKDRKHIIARGRGLMPGFSKQLSEQEIEELAAYTTTLKK